jgi:F-type H+-transporting ATPase subunit delta
MPKNTNMAYPYATALYESAKKSGNIPYWLEVLESLSAIVKVKEFKSLLFNPKISNTDIVNQIMDVLSRLDDNQLASFLNLLAVNRRLECLPEIAVIFTKIFQDDEKVADATLESAYPIIESDKEYFEQKLSATIGKKVQVNIIINPNLIGGVKITIGDKVIDASVLGSIKKMATQLLK